MTVDVLQYELSNKLRVLLAQRPDSTIVELRFVFGGGSTTDPAERNGLASLAMTMVSEGALHVSPGQLAAAEDALGVMIHGRVTAEAAVIGMSALAMNLADALGIYAELISHPQFMPEDVEFTRARQLAVIARERSSPGDLAFRSLGSILYAPQDVYARPLSGSGTERGIASVTVDDLRRYYAEHLVPGTSTLVAVGSFEPARLLQLVEDHFGQWRSSRQLQVSPQPPTPPTAPTVMVIDRPGATQACLAAGLLTIPRSSSRAEPLMVADRMLAGLFSSRLNLNLRESKGWTYGVHSSLIDARSRGVWVIRTTTRHDRAAAAMRIIENEIASLAEQRPCSPEELSRTVAYLVARIPCMHETCAQIAEVLTEDVMYGLPLASHRDLPSRLRGLTPSHITETCREILAAGSPRWTLVGHADELVKQLHDVGYDNIEVTDSGGPDFNGSR